MKIGSNIQPLHTQSLTHKDKDKKQEEELKQNKESQNTQKVAES